MSSKKWLIMFFSLLIILVLISSIIIYVVDPYFHYHAPLSFLQYEFEDYTNERYINNGILRNFDYDAMIIGTSHTENFKTSEFDELFNCNSVKVPLGGAQFKELADRTKEAIKYNKNLKQVLRCITYQDLLEDKDAEEYDEYPSYLYDDNILNDYKYLLSGQALKKSFKDIIYTITNKKTTTFDDYAKWTDGYIYMKSFVTFKYQYIRKKDKIPYESLNQEERQKVIESINQNIVDVVKLSPETQFYIFLSPNSILWWDSAMQGGTILKYIEAEEILIKSLLELKNVKIYSFFSNHELVCDLDKYRDEIHFNAETNSQILKWIKEDKYLLTKQNVDKYIKEEKEFYLNYNYEDLFYDDETMNEYLLTFLHKIYG